MSYAEFLDRKTHLGGEHGFAPSFLPEFLFDFQASLVEWSLRQGRSAIFADCGLGKTPMQLVWAENVVRESGKPVLILTPLAVGAQTVREGEKFGIECRRVADGKPKPGINVTNYERLHHFNASDFSGVVCDESSAIKSFDGKRRALVTDFLRKMPYRLLCTATAAPNDYIELGTSSEALGCLGHIDMLNRFFKNDQNTVKPVRRWTAQRTGWASQSAGGGRGTWRFKRHAELPFWRWVCSWARAMRRPSDLGFDDSRFILPGLEERETLVESRRPPDGMLFALPAVGLREQREERSRTVAERCEAAAALAHGAHKVVVWCHLNREGDLLEKLIDDAVQVSGSDSDDAKESKLTDFTEGRARVLVTKPKIGAWGLNWQHCSHVVYFPSHSYEQYYQAIRRCWRFGQKYPVRVDLVLTEGDQQVMGNLRRKAEAADKMFEQLVAHMRQGLAIRRPVEFNQTAEVPTWL